jgi:uncharacterized protein (DUF433 family)
MQRAFGRRSVRRLAKNARPIIVAGAPALECAPAVPAVAADGNLRYVASGTGVPLMTAHPRIVLDPSICHGKPVIRGSRVPVTVVVASLAGGMTFEEIECEYDISTEDVRAALRFVGEIAEQESFHPLPSA